MKRARFAIWRFTTTYDYCEFPRKIGAGYELPLKIININE